MKRKCIIMVIISFIVLVVCISMGSVNVSVHEALSILGFKLFGVQLPEDVPELKVSIYWTIRMPRVISAFAAGGVLALCGAVMQAVLQNPLASSYTLGVSSGASLGAALVILSGVTVTALRLVLLPMMGFIFGLITVAAAMLLASRIDRLVSSPTIILVGIVISLFVSAIMNLLCSLFPDNYQQLYYWMMGSFSSRKWIHAAILTVSAVIGLTVLMSMYRELDILSFGDEQAMSMGVDSVRYKSVLIVIATLLTGITVSFTGTIGFVDLVAPHIVRRIFGAKHKVVLPMSFFVGGAFMTLSDLAARTLAAPRELPVGAVTAMIGAPFFAYIYLRKRR